MQGRILMRQQSSLDGSCLSSSNSNTRIQTLPRRTTSTTKVSSSHFLTHVEIHISEEHAERQTRPTAAGAGAGASPPTARTTPAPPTARSIHTSQQPLPSSDAASPHLLSWLGTKQDTAERDEHTVLDKPKEKTNAFLTVDQPEPSLKAQYRITRKRHSSNHSPDVARSEEVSRLSWSGSSVMLSASDSDVDSSSLSTSHRRYPVHGRSGSDLRWRSSTDVSMKSSWSVGEMSSWNGIAVGGENAERSSMASILNSFPTTPCHHEEVR